MKRAAVATVVLAAMVFLIARLSAPGRDVTSESARDQSAAPITASIKVGSTLGSPRKVKHVEPIYPARARAAGVSGTVVVEVAVAADGRVERARVVRSIALLDEAALDAVRQWRFEPFRFEGVPTAIVFTVTVTFND